MNTWKPKLKTKYHLRLLPKAFRLYLGINLTKHGRDLYAENYKMKQIKEDLNKCTMFMGWKTQHAVKMSVFPQIDLLRQFISKSHQGFL